MSALTIVVAVLCGALLVLGSILSFRRCARAGRGPRELSFRSPGAASARHAARLMLIM